MSVKLLHTDLMWDFAKRPDVHVYPTAGTVHDLRAECWCRPRINYTDPVGGGRVWVHKAAS